MMQVTKAFYLKTIELKILLALKGMKELFGFKLDDESEMDQAQINQVLFEMYKKELVSARNDKLVLHPEMHELLNVIYGADKILILSEREGLYPEQCVYLSDKAVGLQITGQNKELVRLEGMELSALPEWLMEAGGKLEQIISDESLYREEPIDRPEMQHLAEQLLEKNKGEVFEEKGIRVSFEIISLLTRKKMCMMFLYSDEMQDYIMVSDRLQSAVYLYSKKRLQQILMQYTEGEIK